MNPIRPIEPKREAHALLQALRTNQPSCITDTHAYLLTETPRRETTHLILAIFNQNTGDDRRAIHQINTVYIQHLLEARPELNVLYHGYDPDDWRFILAQQTAATETYPDAPETLTQPHAPDYQQATLISVPLDQLLTLLPDLNELIAFLVSDSDDHLVITRYAQRYPSIHASSETP